MHDNRNVFYILEDALNLIDQLCSLDLSIRLSESGINKHSVYYYMVDTTNNKVTVETKIPKFEYKRTEDGCYYAMNFTLDFNFQTQYKLFHAYTAIELGEMIPPKHYNFYKNEEGYLFLFGEHNTIDRNLANAMAKMLINLIEKRLI